MARYDTEKNFERYDGLDKPKNPKGIFVVPTGSASVLQVSSSIKGGTVGSTKDTLDLLSNLEDGGEYEESWHESVHYLDKRVTEISNGLNKLADAQSNLSGSSASSIATNRAKTPLTIGTGGSNALAGNTTTISTAQAAAITANTAKVSMVIGTKDVQAKAGNTTTISDAQAAEIKANTKKVSMVIGTRSTQAKAGNTTTISDEQAERITSLAKGITNGTGHAMKLTLNGEGALVIEINRTTYTIAAD